MLVFNSLFHRGSLIDSVSGTAMTATNVPFKWDGQKYVGMYNGTSSSMITPTTPIIGLGSWSITVAFKTTKAAEQYLYDDNAGGTGRVNLYLEAAGTILFQIGDGTTSIFSRSSLSYNDGQWHVLTIVFDRTSATGIKFYDKGIQIATSANGNPTTIANPIVPSGNKYIGCHLGTTSFFLNSISMCRIFNHALTQQEITSEYEYALNLKCPQPPKRGFFYPKPTDLSNLSVFQSRMLYNGTSSYTSPPTIPAFGTGDFSILFKCKPTIITQNTLIGAGFANAFVLYISNGYLKSRLSGDSDNTASTTLLSAGVEYSLGYSRTGTTGTYYVNGIAAGTTTDARNYSYAALTLAYGLGYFSGSISLCRIFNYALTAQQVANYSKPEYAIEWVDRGYSGDVFSGWDLTNWGVISSTINNSTSFTPSGLGGSVRKNSFLALGKKYGIRIVANNTGASSGITNYGGGTNYVSLGGGAIDNTFVTPITTGGGILIYGGAANTTMTISSLTGYQLGCVLDLNAEGMASATWRDTTNTLAATNSGTIASLSQGLLASYNMKKQGTTLVDISGSNKNGALTGTAIQTKDGLKFNNSGYYTSTINHPQSAYTISMRVKFNEVGREQHLCEFSSDQRYLSSGNKLVMTGTTNALTGTQTIATGIWYNISFLFKNPGAEIYVNAVSDGSNANYTTATTATSLVIGDIAAHSGSVKFNGEIVDIKIHNRILTLQEIKDYHNSFAKQIVLREDFSSEPADGTSILPREWERISGTFKIGQLTTNVAGMPTLKKGTKYLENITAGVLSLPSKNAFGEFSFDFYKGADANSMQINFIDKDSIYNNSGGYHVGIASSEAIYFSKTAVSDIFNTATSYVANNTWYRLKVLRSQVGVFTLLIKGGVFVPSAGYNGYTLISTIGGSGINPTSADITYIISNYIVVSLGAGDRFTNLVVKEGIEQ